MQRAVANRIPNCHLPVTSGNCQLQVAIASYKWQLPVTSSNCQLHVAVASYKWQLPVIMAIASYCEESLIILLFVKSEILKIFLHKSGKRVKFFMADTSHRTFVYY